MPALRGVLERLGYIGVVTYLRSGNAVFSDDAGQSELKKPIEEALAAEFGFDVPVIVVTGRDLEVVIEACPFRPQADADPTKVHVTFLEPMPPSQPWSDIDPASVAPEEMATGPGVLYMHLPNGMGRAKLPTLLAKRTSGVVATTRNWRTVRALADLVE